MDLDLLMKNLSVKIKCKDVEGTGFLLQSETEECSYVITARHCLEGEGEGKQEYTDEDIKISRCSATEEFVPVIVQKSFVHNNYIIDIAVIKIDYISDIPDIYFRTPNFNEDCYIYGFPRVLNESDCMIKHEIVNAKISGTGIDNGIVEFKPFIRQETTGDRTNKNIQGFSGSAIIGRREEAYILFGIFIELKIPNTPHNTYIGYCNARIYEIIEENKLPSLIPCKLLSFSYYLDKSFENFKPKIVFALKQTFQSEITVVPQILLQDLENRLTIPLCENSYLDERIWCGWAKLIVLLHLMGVEPEKYNEIIYSSIKNEQHHIVFLFSNLNRCDDAFCAIFKDWEEYSNDIENNTVIILNSDKTPYDKFYSKEMVKGIVKRIDENILFENGIDISDPQSYKSISGLHIEYIGEHIDNEIRDEKRVEDINAKIREIMKEVLNSVTM